MYWSDFQSFLVPPNHIETNDALSKSTHISTCAYNYKPTYQSLSLSQIMGIPVLVFRKMIGAIPAWVSIFEIRELLMVLALGSEGLAAHAECSKPLSQAP